MIELASKIDKLGRIVIPAKLRKELALKPGAPLRLTVEEGSLRLQSRERALAEAKAFARSLKTRGSSVVGGLLADRRREARRERAG